MLRPLPFTTFGEIAALGLKAMVYCPGCYEHRPIDLDAEHLRDRCFATTRFRCTKIRYTGDVCGCPGSVEIEPSVLLPVGGGNTLAFLYCSTCLPSWEINHVPIARPPWSVVNREGNDRFKCPGWEGRGLADPRADVAADLPQHFTVGHEIGRLEQSIVRYNLKDDPAAAAAASDGPCAWSSVFEGLPGLRHSSSWK